MKRTITRNLLIAVKPLAKHQVSITVTDQETGLVAVAVWDYYRALFKELKHTKGMSIDTLADGKDLSGIAEDTVRLIADTDDELSKADEDDIIIEEENSDD